MQNIKGKIVVQETLIVETVKAIEPYSKKDLALRSLKIRLDREIKSQRVKN